MSIKLVKNLCEINLSFRCISFLRVLSGFKFETVVEAFCIILKCVVFKKEWWIQDFEDGEGVVPTYYLARFLQKTAWNWKNLVPSAPLDPSMIRYLFIYETNILWNLKIARPTPPTVKILLKIKQRNSKVNCPHTLPIASYNSWETMAFILFQFELCSSSFKNLSVKQFIFYLNFFLRNTRYQSHYCSISGLTKQRFLRSVVH